jgi:hypothetical protein
LQKSSLLDASFGFESWGMLLCLKIFRRFVSAFCCADLFYISNLFVLLVWKVWLVRLILLDFSPLTPFSSVMVMVLENVFSLMLRKKVPLNFSFVMTFEKGGG